MHRSTGQWTESEDEYLRARYLEDEHSEIAEALGRTRNAVRNRCSRLGLHKKIRQHDETTRARIIEFYGAHVGVPMDLRSLAAELGIRSSTIAKIARGYGLTDIARPLSAASRASGAAKLSFLWRMGQHPRGMAGKTHSVKTRRRLSEVGLARFAAQTPTQRSAHVLAGMRKRAKGGNLIPPRPNASWKQSWQTIGGKRNYFRSKWEVNYAHYLEWLKQHGEIAEWEYEPTTFWFEKIKRGVRSYTPDFRVTEKNGSVAYHEIKGWMDDRSVTKLKRMAKYHPNVRMVLVDSAAYKALSRQVLGLVPGWD